MVNEIAILFIVVLVAAIIFMAIKWPKFIVLEDEAPKGHNPKDAWLKLQDEGAKYVRWEDGKVKLIIKK